MKSHRIVLRRVPGKCGSIGWSRSDGREDPKIVAVFQECTPLPLTVSEALVTEDEQAARRSLVAVGLGFLADTLDVPLSSERSAGRDLSACVARAEGSTAQVSQGLITLTRAARYGAASRVATVKARELAVAAM